MDSAIPNLELWDQAVARFRADGFAEACPLLSDWLAKAEAEGLESKGAAMNLAVCSAKLERWDQAVLAIRREVGEHIRPGGSELHQPSLIAIGGVMGHKDIGRSFVGTAEAAVGVSSDKYAPGLIGQQRRKDLESIRAELLDPQLVARGIVPGDPGVNIAEVLPTETSGGFSCHERAPRAIWRARLSPFEFARSELGDPEAVAVAVVAAKPDVIRTSIGACETAICRTSNDGASRAVRGHRKAEVVGARSELLAPQQVRLRGRGGREETAREYSDQLH